MTCLYGVCPVPQRVHSDLWSDDWPFKVRFGEVGHADGEGPEGRHVQALEVCRATGTDAAEGTEGEVIAAGTTGRIVAGDAGVRIFAGLAPDLFAANRTGNVAFRAALAAGKFAPDVQWP